MSALLAGAAAALAIAAVLLLVPAPARAPRRHAAALRAWRARTKEPPANDGEVDAATLLDLTAALLHAGTGIEAALDRLSRAAPGAQPLAQVYRSLAAGASWDHSVHSLAPYPQLGRFCSHLRFAYATGAPTASMLEAAAAQARAEQRQEAERRAAELGVKMMLPLGACFLPAFIVLGVVPVVISMIPDALGI
ncbi:type II secretion system F family protein [Nesterenkonia massiliensis]|uniref:Type II secretion system F family protein n=1 Tax=Nesterenkonia massiliensis TaxID=1232429 RepID=A0ABT2HQR4_9MICC|nr:type II secretion system F family protein [Nesterenkonia massiliensis]MCT1606889.1 type II secretion system F family protein [Nesterenkonia massiliensis]